MAPAGNVRQGRAQERRLGSRQGRSIGVLADLVTYRAVGDETRGTQTVVEITVQPKGGPPPHVIHRHDGAFYVLEGRCSIVCGDRTVEASAGSFVFAPRGVVRRSQHTGDRAGRLLVTMTPSGLEQCFDELGVPATDPATPPPPSPLPDMTTVLAVCERHEVEIRAQ